MLTAKARIALYDKEDEFFSNESCIQRKEKAEQLHLSTSSDMEHKFNAGIASILGVETSEVKEIFGDSHKDRFIAYQQLHVFCNEVKKK
jgi:uncharacterized protein (DUF2126 family)